MKSNSGGIDVETYAMAVARSKKYTDLQVKAVKSDIDGLKLKYLTESEYEAIEPKDDGTIYFVL